MKNTIHKVPHFSKRKFRVILKLFAGGVNAVQIAKLTGLNRNTINLRINRIRKKIYGAARAETLKNADNVQIDETFFECARKFYDRFNLPPEEIVVLGIIDGSGKVRLEIISKVCHARILPIIMETCAKDAIIYTDGHKAYKCLPKLGYKHSSVNHLEDEFARYENGVCITTNRIEGFWCCLKVWFGKYRGIRVKDYEKYLKEHEWRHNHRQENIYKLLLKMFRVNKISN
jgi:transposase-like protein